MHKNNKSGFTLGHIAKIVNDLRVYSGMMETYSLANGAFPGDSNSGELPGDFPPYIKISQWNDDPSIDGDWDIEKNTFNVLVAVSIHQYTISEKKLWHWTRSRTTAASRPGTTAN